MVYTLAKYEFLILFQSGSVLGAIPHQCHQSCVPQDLPVCASAIPLHAETRVEKDMPNHWPQDLQDRRWMPHCGYQASPHTWSPPCLSSSVTWSDMARLGPVPTTPQRSFLLTMAVVLVVTVWSLCLYVIRKQSNVETENRGDERASSFHVLLLAGVFHWNSMQAFCMCYVWYRSIQQYAPRCWSWARSTSQGNSRFYCSLFVKGEAGIYIRFLNCWN